MDTYQSAIRLSVKNVWRYLTESTCMKHLINIKGIPQSELDYIKQVFDADPKVRQMRIKQNLLQRNGKIREALALGKRVNDLYLIVVHNTIEEVEKDSEEIDLATVELPREAAEKLNEIAITLQLAIDIVDTCIIDFNDTLKTADNSLSLEAFDDIQEMGKKIKVKLEHFRKSSKLFNEIPFANKSDSMYSLLRAKSRELLKRKKTK